MKERRNLFKKLVQHHPKLCVLINIVLATILGHLISILIFPTLNEDQFSYCEMIAKNVYEQMATGKAIVEVPKEMKVEITATTIKVRYANTLLRRGVIVAKLENEELVCTKDRDIGVVVTCNIVSGIFLFLLFSGVLVFLEKE